MDTKLKPYTITAFVWNGDNSSENPIPGRERVYVNTNTLARLASGIGFIASSEVDDNDDKILIIENVRFAKKYESVKFDKLNTDFNFINSFLEVSKSGSPFDPEVRVLDEKAILCLKNCEFDNEIYERVNINYGDKLILDRCNILNLYITGSYTDIHIKNSDILFMRIWLGRPGRKVNITIENCEIGSIWMKKFENDEDYDCINFESEKITIPRLIMKDCRVGGVVFSDNRRDNVEIIDVKEAVFENVSILNTKAEQFSLIKDSLSKNK